MCRHLLLVLFVFFFMRPAFAQHRHYPSLTPTISCPSDRIVWVNTRTGIYHLEGERWFGRTRVGQYKCEKAARAEGDRETQNGQ